MYNESPGRVDRMRMPLMHDDPVRATEPGNRCKPRPVHILRMALTRKYGATEQAFLASLFGVDQSAVCRYIRLADRVLKEVLPAPKKTSLRYCGRWAVWKSLPACSRWAQGPTP